MRQAEDAFGLTVGRETLGLYGSDDVRGFSPIAAGNARIDGLYFDQEFRPITRIRQSLTVRVGLAAQGYIFPAPTGVIDYGLRKPDGETRVSALAAADIWGTASIEVDAQLPIVGSTLDLGAGAFVATQGYANGTRSRSHNEGVQLRWRPTASIEVMPFWTRSYIAQTTGPLYLPATETLPQPLPRRRFDGPDWARYRGVAGVYGLEARIDMGARTQLRLGAFHSYYSDRSDAANLLLGLQPDGSFADRLVIIDPPSRYVSNSGELRLTRNIADGARTHLIHLSLRARDRNQRYDGSDDIDLGPGRIGARVTAPQPPLAFSPQSRDHIRQWTLGLAYQLDWTRVGQLGLGVQRTDYRKAIDRPDTGIGADRAHPILFYASGTSYLTSRLWLYGSYTQGLEESGTAPAQAANRGQPVPAIRTRQLDGGVRWAVTPGLKLIGGVFDLHKPYFNLDASNRFVRLGDLATRGAEVSVAGAATKRLDIVVGAVLLDPRVVGDAVTLGRVGGRPIGLPRVNLTFNADWSLPGIRGVSLDGSAQRQSSMFSTTDDRVAIPAQTIVGIGGRYRFILGRRAATLRLAISNLLDRRGYALSGAGAYDVIPGRLVSGYLTVDLR